jgi:ribosome-associated protein
MEEQSNVSGDAVPRQPRLPGLPARDEPIPIDDQAALALARRVVDVAADKKASDVLLLQVSALTTLADYFVICSGGSERQLDAIADAITEALRDEGRRPIGREGNAATHWVLIDYGAVIVHVFAPPEREYYQIERLWADAPALLRIQ